MITATIKNPSHVKFALRREKQRGVDAAKHAIYKESLRLKNLLRSEIKSGAPGGKVFAPLGPMALSGRRSAAARKPLIRLAYMMRFFVFRKGSVWHARLGYVPKTGASGVPRGSRIPWQKILEHQARGFSLDVTPAMRRKFVRMAMPTLGRWTSHGRGNAKTWSYKKRRAGSWQKAGRSGGRMFVEKAKSPFFVRRDTKLRIPARPVIVPFWAARKAQAMQNMKQNFRAAMKDKILNT